MMIAKFDFKASRLYLLFFVLLAFFAQQAIAQVVNINPSTGNVIAAVSYGNEQHLAGYGGVWVHNQLPLDLFTSDSPDLTDAGLPKDHANNIAPKGNKFVWCGGTSKDGFFAIAMPRGYRFTGYRMVITNNVTQADFNNQNLGTDAYSMSETSGSFDGSKLVSVNLGERNTSSSTEYVLQRTATIANDMSNILYFRLGHTSGQFAAVYIQSLEVSFECDKNFIETATPPTSLTSGADCVEIPFQTGRMDLGEIEWKGGSGSYGSDNKAWRYTYTNVSDLGANLMLYNDDGVKDGTASTANKVSGNIKNANDNMHFALQNDVYYIETPTEAITQNSKSIPLGYRITGARLHYANAVTADLALGNSFYITDGEGKYMNTSLEFTDTKVLWQSTTAGKIYSNGTYLMVKSSGFIWKSYSLSTTTSSNQASNFVIDGKNVYYSTGRTLYYITTNGEISTSSSGRATLATESEVEADHNSFTLKLYGTDGTTPAKTVAVNADNASGVLEAVLLNNDALKFEVCDLTGSAAYVYAELTMEALNPYITKTDVVATVKSGEASLAQSYLADDFTFGDNGKISFNVPDNFASGTVQISFDNLTSKKADDTYGAMKSDGYSRYHYVKSDYYDLIGENLQGHRSDAASYDYAKKVRVVKAGNKMFKVNNSDEFKVGVTQSSKTFTYEEFRYSDSEYQSQGGTWAEVDLSKDNTSADCYLVTCDETRYNIAPTTSPRHAFYAYYNTTVTLAVADYEPLLTYVKVYDNAMLATGFDNNAYYGVKVGAKMKDSGEAVASGTGYVFAKQILDQLQADAGKDGCPKDAKHVLYLDASQINSVISSAEAPETYGKVELIQDAIGDNALLYMPAGVTYTLRNVASLTSAGYYRADNNIVLVDKKPFFAPYDIRVDANFYTQYTREVTHNYGKSNYVSLVIPFTVDIYENDGDKAVHENFFGGSKAQFLTMQLTSAISTEKENNYDYEVTGHFTPVEGTKTQANVPYLVRVMSPETDGDDNTNFIVRQNGADIIATPTDGNGMGKSIDGATTTGKIGTASVSFVNHGSLNGVQLARTSGSYFYFAQNRFVLSDNLSAMYTTVNMLPFRTYYDYNGSSSAKYMNISLEPYEDTTTGIGDITVADNACGDVAIATSAGTLTLTANKAVTVGVRNLSGQTVVSLSLAAGDTRQVVLPAGLYLVNGVKVLVK